MRIECTNIGSLGSGVFDFKPGLNAVVGPNGSGKSTLVNALYFAFTGETLNGENIDSLITRGFPSADVFVIGDGYSIRRTISITSTSKIKFVRGDITLTRKKEVDQAVCELFGFVDLSILRIVYFAEQFRAADFVNVTDSVRVQMLSALFGFMRLENIRSSIQKAISDLDTSSVSSEVINQMISALQKSEDARDSLIRRQSELSSAVLDSAAIERLTSVINSPLVGTLLDLKSRLSELSKELESKEVELSTIPTPPSPEDVTKYNDIKRHTALMSDLIQAEKDESSIRESVGLSPADISSFLVKVAATKTTIINKKDELQRQLGLLQSGKCPLTGGVPCPDLRALTDEAAVNAKIEDLDTQLAQVEADQAEMQAAYDDAVALSNRLTQAQYHVSAIRAELAAINIDTEFSVSQHESRLANAETHQELRNRLVDDIAVLRIDISRITEELNQVSSLTEVTQEDKLSAQQSVDRSTQAVSAISEVSSMLSDAEKLVADQRSALRFAEEQNASASRNKVKADKLSLIRQALHRDNLPKLLVEEMLCAVNGKLAQYLGMFNFPYEVNWAPDGAILYSDGAGWYRASQLSGGQKYVLVISLRCALADMLSSVFPVFVLDEPTTGLDVDNREALSLMLSKIVGNIPGNMLIIPTHDEMLLPDANIISVVQ